MRLHRGGDVRSAPMKYALLVFGVIGLIGAGYIFSVSQSAIHEIEALISALIGVCGLGFAGVMEKR